MHDYFNNITRSTYSNSDNTKLLIPGYLVTKIIGARGCMIREIAARSGGTQIKILSDKSAERDLPEIVVSIAGSLKGKQEASAIILEQIELFKNGGPVLTTGSCLNDNIATQYKNSVQGQDSIINKPERRRRLSSSDSSKRRRSRSSSLEERYTKRKDSDVNRTPGSSHYIEKEHLEPQEPPKDPFVRQFAPAPPVSILAPSSRPEDSKSTPIVPKPVTQSEANHMLLSNAKSTVEEEVRMRSILDLEITKVKTVPHVPRTTYKLTLLFSHLEAQRFKEALEWHNKTSLSKVEYQISELKGLNSQSFTLVSNPVTISELIKTHGSKEMHYSTGDNSTTLPK